MNSSKPLANGADDLGAALGTDAVFVNEESGEPLAGHHYHGGLHIFVHGGGAAPVAYELQIANVIDVGENLEALERKLYEWGRSEGYFD